MLGAEEREGHGQRPQPGAAVVLLRGDGVAVLRAERVEVGQGDRAANPARPEPQGRGQEQRPGGAARHRQGSAAGTERNGAGTEQDRARTEGTDRGQSGDAAGTERDGAGRSGDRAGDGAGTERDGAVPAAAGRWLRAPGPRAPLAAPRRKAPGATGFGTAPPPGPQFKCPAGGHPGRGGAMQIGRLLKCQALRSAGVRRACPWLSGRFPAPRGAPGAPPARALAR